MPSFIDRFRNRDRNRNDVCRSFWFDLDCRFEFVGRDFVVDRCRRDEIQQASLIDLISLQGFVKIRSIAFLFLHRRHRLLFGRLKRNRQMFRSRNGRSSHSRGIIRQKRIRRPPSRIETLMNHLIERGRSLFEEHREVFVGVARRKDPHESTALTILFANRSKNANLFRRQTEIISTRRIQFFDASIARLTRRSSRGLRTRRPNTRSTRQRRTQRITSGDGTTLKRQRFARRCREEKRTFFIASDGALGSAFRCCFEEDNEGSAQGNEQRFNRSQIM